MSDPVYAAGIAALGGLGGAVVNWLMNLSVRERTRVHEEDIARLKSDLDAVRSRELAAIESGLRLQAELKLRLHEKSWSLLRELVVAIYECHDVLQHVATEVAIKPAEIPNFVAASAAVVKVEMLAASLPPGVQLDQARDLFKEVLSDIALARFHPTEEPWDLTMKMAGKITMAIDIGKDAMTQWNTSIWEDERAISEVKHG